MPLEDVQDRFDILQIMHSCAFLALFSERHGALWDDAYVSLGGLSQWFGRRETARTDHDDLQLRLWGRFGHFRSLAIREVR